MSPLKRDYILCLEDIHHNTKTLCIIKMPCWQLLHRQHYQSEKAIGPTLGGNSTNHTKKRLPVQLVYYEEYPRIDEAFYREKQVQGWGRKKKQALINGTPELLPELAKCKNKSSHENYDGGFGSAQPPSDSVSAQPPSDSGSAQIPRSKKSPDTPYNT